MSILRHIYSCIDIGSDSIKIVVCELYHERYNLLATATIKSKGIKKGLITDVNEAKNCVKKGFEHEAGIAFGVFDLPRRCFIRSASIVGCHAAGAVGLFAVRAVTARLVCQSGKSGLCQGVFDSFKRRT